MRWRCGSARLRRERDRPPSPAAGWGAGAAAGRRHMGGERDAPARPGPAVGAGGRGGQPAERAGGAVRPARCNAARGWITNLLAVAKLRGKPTPTGQSRYRTIAQSWSWSLQIDSWSKLYRQVADVMAFVSSYPHRRRPQLR